MPLYEYRCEQHGDFTQHADIASRNDVFHCPSCGSDTIRIISAPALSLMNAGNRKAWAKNEKSAHEPMRKKKHSCGHDHSHDNHAQKKQEYMQASPGGRPWMLGH
jgi:putative FmdB family regulatory protein